MNRRERCVYIGFVGPAELGPEQETYKVSKAQQIAPSQQVDRTAAYHLSSIRTSARAKNN